MSRGLALTLLLVPIAAGLLAVAEGAEASNRFPGVTSVHAGAGRVYVAIDGQVVVADEAGTELGVLAHPDGRPWSFGFVSSMSQDLRGGLDVCDSEAHQVVHFAGGSGLAGGERVPLPDPPQGNFEVQRWGEDLAVADTIGHRLLRLSEDPARRASRSHRYPNGLSLLPSGTSQVLAFAGTGAREVIALDEQLRPADVPPARALNDFMGGTRKMTGELTAPGPAGFAHLLDLTAGVDGALVAALCRTVDGDCAIVRAPPGGGRPEIVGSTDALGEDGVDPFWQGLTDLAVTSRGEVLAASPRYSAVLSFAGPGGPPASGFCERCTPEELAPRRLPLQALAAGAPWPNGTRVSEFGDARLRGRYEGSRAARAAGERLGRWGQQGMLATLGVLLVGLLVSRQLAGAHGAARWRALRDELWRGSWPAAAGACVRIGVALGAAGALAWWAGGSVLAALPAVVAAGWLAARFWATPRLIDEWEPLLAERARALHLEEGAPGRIPLLSGERVLWSSFAARTRRGRRQAGALLQGAPLDLAEALQGLAPRPLLVTCTTRRLWLTPLSMFAAPQEATAAWQLDSPLERPPSAPGRLRVVFPEGAREEMLRVPARDGAPREDASVAVRSPEWICPECGQALARCPHRPPPFAAALALHALFPGLGHLVQRRFARARSWLLLAAGFALMVARELAWQGMGVLPHDPSRYAPSLAAFGAVWLGGAVDLWLHDRRRP